LTGVIFHSNLYLLNGSLLVGGLAVGIKIISLRGSGFVVERSGHHVHLTTSALRKLFHLTEKGFRACYGNELSVIGEYATSLFVNTETVKKESLKIRVLASSVARKYSQMEVDALTYAKLFGYACPKLRHSGDIKGADKIRIFTEYGEMEVAVIVPFPHLHIPTESSVEPFHLQTPMGIIVPIAVKNNKTRGGYGYIHIDAALHDAVMIRAS